MQVFETNKSTDGRSIMLEVIVALFVMLFIYAAVSKLLEYETFNVQLSKSPLLTSFAPLVAVGIPLIEIVISVMLLFNRMRLAGLYASLFLMTTFTAYLIAIINFSYYIPCSCGGILSGLSWNSHIIFNCAFIILAITGIWLQNNTKKRGRSKDMGQTAFI